MLLFQIDDAREWRARMEAKGVRVVWGDDSPGAIANHFHPKDTPGAIVSIDTMLPLEDWHQELAAWKWAGPDWQRHVRTERTQAVTAVEIQSDDPAALVQRWSALFERPVARDFAGRTHLKFDNMTLRFVADRDGRGVGISALDILPQGSAHRLAWELMKLNHEARFEHEWAVIIDDDDLLSISATVIIAAMRGEALAETLFDGVERAAQLATVAQGLLAAFSGSSQQPPPGLSDHLRI